MRVDPDDVAGFSQLAGDAVIEISKLVEAAQKQIALVSTSFIPEAQGPAVGIAGLIHETIRGIAGNVDKAVQHTCAPHLKNNIQDEDPCADRERIVAALNGVVGDHLAATHNPLAIALRLRHNGCPLKVEKDALLAALPVTGKLLVLVHGLCRNDLQWTQQGHDYGSHLARDVGYTPLYLRYNSGLHISENGQKFADLLEILVARWPGQVQELAIIGHSAGGLVSRSAYHYGTAAGHQWPDSCSTSSS